MLGVKRQSFPSHQWPSQRPRQRRLKAGTCSTAISQPSNAAGTTADDVSLEKVNKSAISRLDSTGDAEEAQTELSLKRNIFLRLKYVLILLVSRFSFEVPGVISGK